VIQQPSRLGHRLAAVRIVQIYLGAWPVEHSNPQPAWVGTDLLRERPPLRRGVVRLARHPAADRIQHAGRVPDAPRHGTVNDAAGQASPISGPWLTRPGSA